MRFENKTAIVTGGGSGIGRATAERLARGGANLVIADIDAGRANQAAEALKAAYGVRAVPVVGDVSQEATAASLVGTATDDLGGLDILINAAGIHHTGDIDEVSLEDWNRVIATNLTSMFLISRAAIPAMARQKSGSIVNLGSVSSFIGQEMQGKSSFVYNVTKAGVRQLTTSLATRHAVDGIRVNCVCPGAVRTRMSLSEEHEAIPPVRDAILAAMAEGHPMARVADPDEIAAAIAFLASDDASFITGTAMPVDGGYLAR
ncbi:SDR family NAD(P)-dependent oxidoreductase [Brevundimonas guildfordensis]|uniref:Glucose 1-dehydrogenase n=1 Tax=Brevundimonas guildfordensis TaxID=2762241 RepID=A0ABR8QWN1_9CAUL|nr:glucose 1-dehydrogenase [Brevundimonas guildfordensis]MBD7939945.1 glucose 1-dehydrogenase [Brevundimonas guildfordensis]